MNFPVQPLLDNVIVREHPAEDYRAKVTGILSTEKSMDKSLRGTVVAVGQGVPIGGVMVPMPVSVGDVVLFTEYSLTDDARILLNPEDAYKPELPVYYRIRVADLKGVVRV